MDCCGPGLPSRPRVAGHRGPVFFSVTLRVGYPLACVQSGCIRLGAFPADIPEAGGHVSQDQAAQDQRDHGDHDPQDRQGHIDAVQVIRSDDQPQGIHEE